MMLLDSYKPTLARKFVAASSQYLTLTGAVVTGEPLTMACWFNSDSVAALQCPMSLGANASNGYYALRLRGDSTDYVEAVKQQPSSLNGVAGTTTAYKADRWHHGAAVFASDTSRSAYLDGAGKATDTTSITDPTIAFSSVGAQKRSSAMAFMSGQIAWPAIWNIALTESEVALLASGAHPRSIRPESLVAFWDWTGAGIEQGRNAAYPLTNTGGSVPVNGPAFLRTRIARPALVGGFTQPAAGGFKPYWALNRSKILGGGTA